MKVKAALEKLIDKLSTPQWVIGTIQGNIEDIIRSKTFDPDINWVPVPSKNKFYADPFLFKTGKGRYDILFEEYAWDEGYGKISLATIKNGKLENHKVLLDTQSHLSYPFVFREDNRTYLFPESAQSGKFSCYEYDPVQQSVRYLQTILDLPLLDGTILKRNEKYWLFGILREKDAYNEYKLCVFFSGHLLGPYTPHPMNPVRNSLNGTRSAGNFIEVDGVIYRPAQNCENVYGESITINKVQILNEVTITEEFYMSIHINKKNKNNRGMRAIHTINAIEDRMVVDGILSRFSPVNKIKRRVKRIFSRS